MLQVIFGDDEHTAAEGPYVRVLKTRKWLYLISLASVAVSQNLYDAKAAKAALKFISLPTHILEVAFALGIAYLSFQYLLLIGQLYSTYDIVLDERFTFRRADDLFSATEREKSARSEYEIALSNMPTPDVEGILHEIQNAHKSRLEAQTLIDSDTQKIQNDSNDIKKQFRETRLAQARDNLSLADSKIAQLSQRLSEFNKIADANNDSNVVAAKEKLEVATANRIKLVRQSPALRPGYTFLEKVIDIGRILPPFGFALYAMVGLYR